MNKSAVIYSCAVILSNTATLIGDLLLQAAAWINFTNVGLSKRSQTHKNIPLKNKQN